MDATCCGQRHSKKFTLPSLVGNALLCPHKSYQKTRRVFAKERVKSAKEVKIHTLLPITVLPKTESPEGRDCVKMGAGSLTENGLTDSVFIFKKCLTKHH